MTEGQTNQNIDLAFLARQNERILVELVATRRELADIRADLQEQGRKIDKLSVDLLAVRGRVRNVENGIETIARVLSADADR